MSIKSSTSDSLVSAVMSLQKIFIGAKWEERRGPYEDNQIAWKCIKCGKSGIESYTYLEVARLPPGEALRNVTKPFLEHFCNDSRHKEKAVNLLLAIIEVCNRVWVESIDDSQKRFCLLELT